MPPRHAARESDPTTELTPEPTRPEPPRSGPLPLDSDSWDVVADDESDRYHGRRRRPGGRTGRAGRLVPLVAVLVVTGGTVALLQYPSLRHPSSLPALDDLPPGPTMVVPLADPTLATAGPGTAEASASPGASRPAGSGDTVAVNPLADGTDSTSSNEVATVVEAETAVLTGSAAVAADAGSSGGQLVTALGNWGAGQPGTVQFTDVPVPSAGAYRITVHLTNGETGVKRDVVVQVAAMPPVSISFSGRATCCGARGVQVNLPAGTVTITITNPDGPAPSLDKIELITV